jgi:ABC-type Fe3+ transport system substrate-binding protein
MKPGSVLIHLGAWAYVYTIGYRADLLKDVKFDSWNDLWKPELKGKIAAPDFDPEPHHRGCGDSLRERTPLIGNKATRQTQGAETELQGVLYQRC